MLIQLGCTELGVAWDLADLASPPPLFTFRSQRDTTDAMAMGRLVALGLIDPLGVIRPDLRQVMAAFAASRVQLDVRFTTARGELVRAAAVSHDGVTYLAVVTDGDIRFSRAPADATLAAVVDVVPPRRAAGGIAVTLPVGEVDDAVIKAMEHGLADSGADRDELFVTALVQRGVAESDARLFAGLAIGARSRVAEFGVTLRDRHGVARRSPRALRVIDTHGGRAVQLVHGGYVTVTPADRATVLGSLARLRDAELDRLDGNRLG